MRTGRLMTWKQSNEQYHNETKDNHHDETNENENDVCHTDGRCDDWLGRGGNAR